MKFYIGTTNFSKIQEIAAILASTGCEFEKTDRIDPEETEPDFVGNAILKGKAYAAYVGKKDPNGFVISEDSGLIIPALGKLPGPWSARFADGDFDYEAGKLLQLNPSHRSREDIDSINNDKVLCLMKSIALPYRAAMFKVVLVVAKPTGEILFQGEGETHGWISQEKRGKNGFGYDPIFIGSDTFGKTFAELDSYRKNLKSHRRKVLQEFKGWLAKVIKS